MQKLLELYFWQNLLKFHDKIKMDLSVRMKIIYNGKYRSTICLKFGERSVSPFLIETSNFTMSQSLAFQNRQLNGFHSMSDIKLP